MALAVENDNRTALSEPEQQRAPRYERFSESRLWAQQRAYFQEAGIEAWRRGEVPHYITSTAGMARQYAETIVRYWESALAAGEIDIEKPLYVLELGAGCGRLAYLLLKALRERLVHSAPFRLCYLASDIVAANIDFIASHPYLRPEVEAGRLDTLLWDAEEGGALNLREKRLSVVGTDNPLAVVANYVFDGLRHDLIGFHYGKTLEGRVALDGEALRYEWKQIERADWLPAAWQRHVARYAERLDSASVLFPSGALRCMEHIGALTRGRYLLLSADKGVYSERQLRTESSVEPAFHGSFSLQVNYHALSARLEEQGAKVWNSRHRTDGLVYHLALRAEQPERHAHWFAEVVEGLEELNPDDHFTLKKAMETAADRLPQEQLLSMLRLGRYDYRILGLMIDPLLAQAGVLDGDALRLWHEALERSWSNYYPFGEQDRFPARFAALAAALGHGDLARHALHLSLALEDGGPGTLHQLACCEEATGRSADALAALERALAIVPGDGACLAFRDRLRSRLEAPAKAPWRCSEDSSGGELALEPLEIEHAASLLRQYRDPQIGVMARLPELTTLEQTVEWIVEQRGEAERVACAVMHRCWGFAGVVSLQRHGDAGYFYFWMGTDHQGSGYGRRAASMLFELARANGLRELFTSAYADNVRSRSALAALGFEPLQVNAAAPDDELLFFRRSLGAQDPALPGAPEDRLRALCEAIDSPLRLNP